MGSNCPPLILAYRRIFLEKAYIGKEGMFTLTFRQAAGLGRAKFHLIAFLYADRQMSKFQIIFLHMQHENSKWKSLILFNGNFDLMSEIEICRCVLEICNILPSTFLTHDTAACMPLY